MELKHGFKKIDKMQYEITVTEAMFKKIDNIVTEISINKAEEFISYHNQFLFDTIMTRYIACLFMETGEKVDNTFGLAVITVHCNGRSFKVSTGDVNVSKDKTFKIAGLLYDN